MVAEFGPPYTQAKDAIGTVRLIVYGSPSGWMYCGIDFEQSRATNVRFWGK